MAYDAERADARDGGRMRVLVTLDFPPEHGGIQTYLAGIVRHAFGADDRVLVGSAVPRPNSSMGSGAVVEYHAGPFARLNKKWSLVPLLFRCMRLKSKTPEAVVECGNIYAAIVPWLLRMPYAVYTYGTELLAMRKRGSRAALLRRVLRAARRRFALGAHTQRLLNEVGISCAAEIVAPRIDPPPSDSVERRTYAAGEARILCVGRLVPHKGHAVLIAAARLLPPGLGWRLTIVGDGPERARLQALAGDGGHAGRIAIKTGLTDAQLSSEYEQATMLVHPSLELEAGTEGFGIVLVEAMAHGVPIVASRAGGIDEVMADCGVLVPPEDAAALAEAIAALSRDAARRKELAQRAFFRLNERYVWK
jgi:glycosyltransferase involved in cell wall biosynthesis